MKLNKSYFIPTLREHATIIVDKYDKYRARVITSVPIYNFAEWLVRVK